MPESVINGKTLTEVAFPLKSLLTSIAQAVTNFNNRLKNFDESFSDPSVQALKVERIK